MNYKQLAIGVAIGVILATGLGFVISRTSMSNSLGTVVGVGQVQTNTFWFYNGLYAGTTQQWSVSSAGAMTVAGITDTGTLSFGGGTTLTKIVCNTTSTTFGSIASAATTTLDVALSGATSTFHQVYSVGIATSTAARIQATAQPSSTTGFATVTLENLGSTWNVTTSTVSVCYTQF